MSRILFEHTYDEIISPENLLESWCEFVKGKRSRVDVQVFELDLMSNILSLHESLRDDTYRHSAYQAFTVSDPKARNIHKASVKDRLLHRAIYRKLYPFFDRTFITDSFSCRLNKGTHRALDRFACLARRSSSNHCKTVWVLKCDIRKFFASINHDRLLALLDARIIDKRLVALLYQIVGSFDSDTAGVGLPLGNLTSQLFANVYMDVLDQFVKHRLHTKHYIRYADDFVFMHKDRGYLESVLPLVETFLSDELRLQLHPDKIELKTVASGVDFLGWVHFPGHRVLRTTTKRRMLRTIAYDRRPQVIASYLGLLKHGNANKITIF
jgi:retron-type reverse transcriptase